MTVLSLEQAIERSGGELRLNSEWRRVEDLTLSRSEPGKGNPLLADAEKRRRLAGGAEAPLALSLGDVGTNALIRDAERRVEVAERQRERAYTW